MSRRFNMVKVLVVKKSFSSLNSGWQKYCTALFMSHLVSFAQPWFLWLLAAIFECTKPLCTSTYNFFHRLTWRNGRVGLDSKVRKSHAILLAGTVGGPTLWWLGVILSVAPLWLPSHVYSIAAALQGGASRSQAAWASSIIYLSQAEPQALVSLSLAKPSQSKSRLSPAIHGLAAKLGWAIQQKKKTLPPLTCLLLLCYSFTSA